MAFVPHYALRIPVVAGQFRKWCKRYREMHGEEVDFTKGYWTPPLSPHMVYESEARQIADIVGLRAIVSLTDHDDIEASSYLKMTESLTEAPVSFEWTVPFGSGFFHVGVHNLPPQSSAEIIESARRYTENPAPEDLSELFEMLHQIPETLIVLNHPLWDIEFAGAKQHEASLTSFLENFRQWIHALEVNGYRSWRENKRVVSLAKDADLPVVAGGDRHGCDANVVLNLTRGETLAAFVEEVRRDKRSEVVLMPEYVEPLIARQLKGFADVVREYPDFPHGQQRWPQRVYFNVRGTGVHPIAHFWPQQGAPKWIRRITGCLCMLGSPPIQPMLRMALFNRKKAAHRDISRTQAQFVTSSE